MARRNCGILVVKLDLNALRIEKNLDLFITVSNSTAHFAGALGIPTILICPKKSSTYFYWNTSSGSSIWYKNIKVLGIENSISKTIKQINNIVEKNNEFNFSKQ